MSPAWMGARQRKSASPISLDERIGDLATTKISGGISDSGWLDYKLALHAHACDPDCLNETR
jgi:hypothetical protein